MAMETLKNIAGILGMLLCVILGLIVWVLFVTYGPYLTVVVMWYGAMILVPLFLLVEGYKKIKYRQWCNECRVVTFSKEKYDPYSISCSRCTLKRGETSFRERNVR
jgi:hypothetical protein